jgi:hypothetical protein
VEGTTRVFLKKKSEHKKVVLLFPNILIQGLIGGSDKQSMKSSLFSSLVVSIVVWGNTNGQKDGSLSSYNCSLPGLELVEPGKFEGVTANYLSFNTQGSTPNFPIRALEFEAFGKIRSQI